MKFLCFCLLAPFLFVAEAARSDDVTILLHRMDKGTELYFKADAETLFSLFGVSDDIVPVRSGGIDYDRLQMGTWQLGDQLTETASLSIGQSDAEFEAMSFMLHPASSALPLQTPMDGLMAIGVCNAVSGASQASVEDTVAYVGYFAHASSQDRPMKISLQGKVDRSLNVLLLDYGPTGGMASYESRLEPGQSLDLTVGQMPQPTRAQFVLGTVFAMLAFGASLLCAAGRPHMGFGMARLKPS